MSTEIGQRIKTARLNAGLTQKELSEKSGIAEITIRQYENGKRIPRIDYIEKIANALDLSLLHLLGTVELHIIDNEIDANITQILESQEGEQVTEYLENIKNLHAKELKIDDEYKDINIRSKTKDDILLRSFHQLNAIGQDKAIEQVDLLTKIPEYRKDTEDK